MLHQPDFRRLRLLDGLPEKNGLINLKSEFNEMDRIDAFLSLLREFYFKYINPAFFLGFAIMIWSPVINRFIAIDWGYPVFTYILWLGWKFTHTAYKKGIF